MGAGGRFFYRRTKIVLSSYLICDLQNYDLYTTYESKFWLNRLLHSTIDLQVLFFSIIPSVSVCITYLKPRQRPISTLEAPESIVLHTRFDNEPQNTSLYSGGL